MNAQDWYIENKASEGKIEIQQLATGGLGDIYLMLPS
jgi:hypothetical protein